MCDRIISVCVKASTQPDNCFGIEIELRLGEADPHHPLIGKIIARRKPKCLVDMSFGFCAPTE